MTKSENHPHQNKYFAYYKAKINKYSPVSEESWLSLKSLMTFKNIAKNEFIVTNRDIAKNIYFICVGAMRSFIIDENGNEYNKSLFFENDFVTATTSCLLSQKSNFTIEALEETTLISIEYNLYEIKEDPV